MKRYISIILFLLFLTGCSHIEQTREIVFSDSHDAVWIIAYENDYILYLTNLEEKLEFSCADLRNQKVERIGFLDNYYMFPNPMEIKKYDKKLYTYITKGDRDNTSIALVEMKLEKNSLLELYETAGVELAHTRTIENSIVGLKTRVDKTEYVTFLEIYDISEKTTKVIKEERINRNSNSGKMILGFDVEDSNIFILLQNEREYVIQKINESGKLIDEYICNDCHFFSTSKIAQFYVYQDYITVCSYNDLAIYKIHNDKLDLVCYSSNCFEFYPANNIKKDKNILFYSNGQNFFILDTSKNQMSITKAPTIKDEGYIVRAFQYENKVFYMSYEDEMFKYYITNIDFLLKNASDVLKFESNAKIDLSAFAQILNG